MSFACEPAQCSGIEALTSFVAGRPHHASSRVLAPIPGGRSRYKGLRSTLRSVCATPLPNIPLLAALLYETSWSKVVPADSRKRGSNSRWSADGEGPNGMQNSPRGSKRSLSASNQADRSLWCARPVVTARNRPAARVPRRRQRSTAGSYFLFAAAFNFSICWRCAAPCAAILWTRSATVIGCCISGWKADLERSAGLTVRNKRKL
jgi:hypothetical protein